MKAHVTRHLRLKTLWIAAVEVYCLYLSRLQLAVNYLQQWLLPGGNYQQRGDLTFFGDHSDCFFLATLH